MHVRRREDGALLEAHLQLREIDKLHRRFLLIMQDTPGHQVAFGPLSAAIGYEIFAGSAAERVALRLAGFHLCPVGRTADRIQRLATTVHSRPAKLRRLDHPVTASRPHIRSKHASLGVHGRRSGNRESADNCEGSGAHRHLHIGDAAASAGRRHRHRHAARELAS
jgi:hypothetical protein